MTTHPHRTVSAITDRQRAIVSLIAAGCLNDEVGERLGISPRTVKAHSDALRHKLGVSRRRHIPAAYRLRHRNLDAEDLTTINGVPIVTPRRAIVDGIEAGLRLTLIEQAIDTAQRQAMVTTDTAQQLRVLRDELAHVR